MMMTMIGRGRLCRRPGLEMSIRRHNRGYLGLAVHFNMRIFQRLQFQIFRKRTKSNVTSYLPTPHKRALRKHFCMCLPFICMP